VTVLVMGAGGQLGKTLLEKAPPGVAARGVTHAELDVADEKALSALIEKIRPSAVINAAGFTQVDAAEEKHAEAQRANAEGPRVLATVCARANAHLVHVSTDYVFDGEQNRPYRPTDMTAPLSVYGASKRDGELHVTRILGDRACIVRTSWVYSATGRNFITSMLGRLKSGTKLRVVSDQIGAPTATFSLAEVLWRFARTPLGGIYHWSDAGVASWYDLTVALAEEAWELGLIPADYHVESISTEEYPTPAKRPRYSLLDRRATEAALSMSAAHWRVNLRTTLRAIARGATA